MCGIVTTADMQPQGDAVFWSVHFSLYLLFGLLTDFEERLDFLPIFQKQFRPPGFYPHIRSNETGMTELLFKVLGMILVSKALDYLCADEQFGEEIYEEIMILFMT